MQKNIKTMETTTDFLLLKKLKQLKTDVDQIVLKEIPDAPIVSYRHKKPSDTEIDKLFGELQFRDSKAIIEETDNQKVLGNNCDVFIFTK
ncbi:unnamed protein product [Mytilus coruscus]|nr:unnamed protein product [Mytilus coruscus]